MTRYGFDWEWDTEHNTWCIHPTDEDRQKRSDDDFLAALKAKLS